MASHTNYIGWLVIYSGLLGLVAGILMTDYFLLRKTRLDLQSLYPRHGAYEYTSGFNLRAVVAFVAGAFVALIGLAVPGLRPFYDHASLVRFFISSALYLLLTRTANAEQQQYHWSNDK